jgi:formate hydrogenlyase subunit 4
MTILLSILAQLLHMAAVLIAAPLLTGLVGRLSHRRAAPDMLLPWNSVLRLLRKQPIRAIGTSVVARRAPLMAMILAVLTVSLVPSFCVGMASAPLTDLLTIAGLLILGRVVVVLAAMDAGTGGGAVAATEIARLGLAAEPVLLLAVLAIGLAAGAGNLDAILAMRAEGLVPGTPAVMLAMAALALLGWSDGQSPKIDAFFSGPHLALLRVSEQIRLLTWCDLVGGLALPYGMATVTGGFSAWVIGVLAWIGRTLLAAALLALVRNIATTARVRTVLALAAALCGIAAVLAFGGGDPT